MPLCPLSGRSDEKLELQWTLEGHQLGVVSVDISHNGAIAASSSLDAHIRLWDLESGKQIKSMDAGPGRSLLLGTQGGCSSLELKESLRLSTGWCSGAAGVASLVLPPYSEWSSQMSLWPHVA